MRQSPPEARIFSFSLALLKSETTTIMWPKCSEHIEFSMCENVWIRGIEDIYNAELPCVGFPIGVRPSRLLICLLTLHHLFLWSEASTEPTLLGRYLEFSGTISVMSIPPLLTQSRYPRLLVLMMPTMSHTPFARVRL